MSSPMVDFSLVKSLPGLFWALNSGAGASGKVIKSSLEREVGHYCRHLSSYGEGHGLLEGLLG